MPNSFKAGIATSALHVVGLHEPPKNTSTGAEEVLFSRFLLQSSTLLNDFVLRNSPPGKLQFFVAFVVASCLFVVVAFVVEFVAVVVVSVSLSVKPLLSSVVVVCCCREPSKLFLSQ